MYKIKRFSTLGVPNKIKSEFNKILKSWQTYDEYLGLIINSDNDAIEMNEGYKLGDWYPILGLGTADIQFSNYIAYNTKLKKFGTWNKWYKGNDSYVISNDPLKDIFRNYFIDRWIWNYVEELGRLRDADEAKNVLKINLKLIDRLMI